MAFLEKRIPSDMSMGMVGGPGYSTDVVGLGSGFESRNQNWIDGKCRYDAAKACKNDAFKSRLVAFFRIVKGRFHGFRFKDWTDYKVSKAEGRFEETDTELVWQLVKRYSIAGLGTEDRPIRKPAAVAIFDSSGALLAAGVDYTVDMTTGIVTQLTEGVTLGWWTGEFDVPVRFDIDYLPLSAETPEFFRAQNIPIVEIRV